MYLVCAVVSRSQMRAFESLELELQVVMCPLVWCGELNLGLLQVHQVPFTSGPFPQLLEFIFNLQHYYQARSNACNDFEGGIK